MSVSFEKKKAGFTEKVAFELKLREGQEFAERKRKGILAFRGV